MNICQKLNLKTDDIEYIASGFYGNAYKVGDKVLKITTHKDEAKSVYNLIKKDINSNGIVKYYSVNMYKLKNQYVYVILMDYVLPLRKFLTKKYGSLYKTEEDLINYMLNIFYNYWRKLDTKEHFVDLVNQEYQITHKTVVYFIDKMWDLYQGIKFLSSYPDLHIGNIGIKDNKFIFFDYSRMVDVRKFNAPSIIK